MVNTFSNAFVKEKKKINLHVQQNKTLHHPSYLRPKPILVGILLQIFK